MIKTCSTNLIDKAKEGWRINENSEMDIDYYTGAPYPSSITNLVLNENDISINNECSEDSSISSSDEDSEDDTEDDDWRM